MNTIEDFKNAPTGATATSEMTGNRVMKMDDIGRSWITSSGLWCSDAEIARWGYTLDPSAPTTAREALDLAWELAHPVKEGQVIPEGARFMEFYDTGVREYTALWDIEIGFHTAPALRTVEPLPAPEPDWLDAPAVIAHVDAPNVQPTSVFVPTGTHPDRWARFDSEWTFHWNELRNVIPLYPREGQNS